jgi:hypothetical protein
VATRFHLVEPASWKLASTRDRDRAGQRATTRREHVRPSFVATRFHLVEPASWKLASTREGEPCVTPEVCPTVATRFHLVEKASWKLASTWAQVGNLPPQGRKLKTCHHGGGSTLGNLPHEVGWLDRQNTVKCTYVHTPESCHARTFSASQPPALGHQRRHVFRDLLPGWEHFLTRSKCQQAIQV